MRTVADIFRAAGPAYVAAHAGRLLPCDHSLLTFTLPSELRALARLHQAGVYAALLREAAATVQTLAEDRTWVGGTLGILAVLHTWSRTMESHPHAHLLVQEASAARPRTGGLRSTPDFAAASRGKNLYFVMQCGAERSASACAPP